MRVIFYTGKGGVGKTTVSAATALRASELGYRTVILSADPAHSLGDSLDTSLSGVPQPIAPNLWGQELDILQEIETHWATIQDWVTLLMARWGMEAETMADEMASLPGMGDLSALLYINRYHDNGEYDLVILDCAPTGQTLQLLSFPDSVRSWIQKAFPIGKGVSKMLRPLGSLLKTPFPGDKVFDSMQSLFSQLGRVKTFLEDPANSSVRLVVNPEKMVIKETQRTFTYLNLYGYSTDLIVCNRFIPDKVEDRYFDSWKQSQSKYYQIIEECFAPVPILRVPLLDQEVVGIPMIKQLADALFGERDPAKVFFQGQPFTIKREDKHYVLTMALPFATKGDISLAQNGDELIIQVRNYRRNLVIPPTLARLAVKEARFEAEKLKVTFAPSE